MKSPKPTYSELLAIATEAVKLIEERQHYVSPTPESERPSFRTLAGCAGSALTAWQGLVEAARQ